jgi:hypothetical protein
MIKQDRRRNADLLGRPSEEVGDRPRRRDDRRIATEDAR